MKIYEEHDKSITIDMQADILISFRPYQSFVSHNLKKSPFVTRGLFIQIKEGFWNKLKVLWILAKIIFKGNINPLEIKEESSPIEGTSYVWPKNNDKQEKLW